MKSQWIDAHGQRDVFVQRTCRIQRIKENVAVRMTQLKSLKSKDSLTFAKQVKWCILQETPWYFYCEFMQSFHVFPKSRVWMSLMTGLCFLVFRANPVCIVMCAGSDGFILLAAEQECHSFCRKTQRMCSDPQALLCMKCTVMFLCEWLSKALLPSSANRDVQWPGFTTHLAGLQLLIHEAESWFMYALVAVICRVNEQLQKSMCSVAFLLLCHFWNTALC